jgi:hypothetical protein
LGNFETSNGKKNGGFKFFNEKGKKTNVREALKPNQPKNPNHPISRLKTYHKLALI